MRALVVPALAIALAPACGGDAAPPVNTTCFAPATSAEVATRLGDTGCVDRADLRRPAPGLLAYTVRVPLWSDGADKERHLALPRDGRIEVGAGGHLELPVGTVLMKRFSLGGRPVETRLLVRHASGAWAGYSYAWDGGDAALVGEDGRYQPLATQEWQFPSRQHCLDCHTEAAGRTLGLDLAQLEPDVVAGWAARGLFVATPPAVERLPRPSEATAPIGDRARAYLHANCANCHRPNGVREPNVTMDLRFTTPLAEARICDERPRRTDFGMVDVKLLAPGDPDRSMLWLRIHTLIPTDRMPPVASTVEDAEGERLLREWIASIGSCPR
jgi:uncharacterized repeat protein (TIGR03806 family)